jgi:hypothetical protein
MTNMSAIRIRQVVLDPSAAQETGKSIHVAATAKLASWTF